MSHKMGLNRTNLTFLFASAVVSGCAGQAPIDTCSTNSALSAAGANPCSGSGGATTGGTGSSGGGAGKGGSAGSSSLPPLDLTCHSDSDCCIASDTCRALAVLYSKLQGLLYWPPATMTVCSKCYTPVVEVSCVNNQCTGTIVNSMGYSGTPGVGSHCGKLTTTGTGGTSSTATGGASSKAAYATSVQLASATSDPTASNAAAIAASTQTVFGCGG